MRALTLWRPWDTAILRLGKPVENRDRPPPAKLIGQRFALHSGKKFDMDGAATIFLLAHKEGFSREVIRVALARSEALDSVILGTVKLARVISRDRPQLGAPDPLASSPYFFGDYGWVCEDVFALPEPVPCKGAQGLWSLPPDVEAKVLAQEVEHFRPIFERQLAMEAAING